MIQFVATKSLKITRFYVNSRQLLLQCSDDCIHAVVRDLHDELPGLIKAQFLFQIMDVLSADSEGTVIHNIVLQWDVGFNTVYHHFA